MITAPTDQALALQAGVHNALDLLAHLTPGHAAALLAELFTSTTDPQELAAILASPACPPLVLADAATLFNASKGRPRQTHLKLLAVIAVNPNTNRATLAALSWHADSLIRVAVARNPHTAPALLLHLAADSNWEVRQQVAKNPTSPTAALHLLIEDKDSGVQAPALRNPALPVDDLLSFMTGKTDIQLLRAAAGHPHLPAIAALSWARHHAPTVRAAIARHPALPAFALSPLLAEGDLRVEVGVANHPKLPLEMALALSNPARSINTRLTLAGNPTIPPLAAVLLLVDEDAVVRRRTALTQSTLKPSTLVQAALEEQDHRVLAALISHPNTPATAVRLILAQAVRWNTGAAVPLARALTYRPGPLTADLAYAIAAIADPRALRVLVSRPECPDGILAACAQHDDPAFRRAAASNPAIPSFELGRLAHDPDPAVALLATTHPWHLALTAAHSSP